MRRDDIHLLGPPDVVATALQWLRERIPALIGAVVRLRLDKCTVFSPEGDLSAFPEEVRGARRGERLLGITVLGIPVGSDGFVVRVLEDAVQ